MKLKFKNIVFSIPLVLLLVIIVLEQGYLYEDVTKSNLPKGLRVNSMDAEFIDVDEDNDLDIVVAVENAKNILLINDGHGKFTHSYELTNRAEDSEDIGIADFNGDGHLDILFVSEDTPNNELYFGDGKGHFTPANENIPIHQRSNAVIVEDLNADGYPDVIVGNSIGPNNPGYNTILINNGNGKFIDETSKRLPLINDDTQDLIMGDVNGDGYSDLVIANENSNRMYFNSGDGTFTDQSHRLDTNNEIIAVTREVCLSDVDADGDLDIIFFNNNGVRQNQLLINDGNGNFKDETERRLPLISLRTWDGGIYDVNYDGSPDIVTANSTGSVSGERYEVYLNNGLGYFTNHTLSIFPTSVRGAGWDVEAADLNGDGWLDFYLSARSNDTNKFWSQDRLLFGKRAK